MAIHEEQPLCHEFEELNDRPFSREMPASEWERVQRSAHAASEWDRVQRSAHAALARISLHIVVRD
jgi:hypothetical protein